MGSIMAILKENVIILGIFLPKICIITVSKLKSSASKLKYSAQVLLGENISEGMTVTQWIYGRLHLRDSYFLLTTLYHFCFSHHIYWNGLKHRLMEGGSGRVKQFMTSLYYFS